MEKDELEPTDTTQTETPTKKIPQLSACLVCRRKKKRCDKVRPACARCILAKTECVWDPEPTPKPQKLPKKRVAKSPNNSTKKQARGLTEKKVSVMVMDLNLNQIQDKPAPESLTNVQSGSNGKQVLFNHNTASEASKTEIASTDTKSITNGKASISTKPLSRKISKKDADSNHKIDTKLDSQNFSKYFGLRLFKRIFNIDHQDTISKISTFRESNALPELYLRVMNFDLLLAELNDDTETDNICIIMMVYSVLLVGATLDDDQSTLDKIESDLKSLIQATPDSVEKVRSMLLLVEYCFKKSNIEEAWKYLYQVTSIAYGLNIHTESEHSKLWSSLVFYDTLICAAVGRASSIIIPFFSNKKDNSFKSLTKAMRNTNIEIFKNNAGTKTDLKTFNKIENDILKCLSNVKSKLKSKNDKYSESSLLSFQILLLYSLIKLYFFNLQVLENIGDKFGSKLNDFLKVFEKFIKLEKKLHNFRNQFPFIFFFCFQTFIVLLSCLYESYDIGSPEQEQSILTSFKNCYMHILQTSSISDDESLMDILRCIERSRKEKIDSSSSSKLGNSDSLKYDDFYLSNAFNSAGPYDLETLETFFY